MPPKAKPAAGAVGNDAQRQKDALILFDSLFNITSPVVVNIAEIALKTGEKSNTIAKRFSTIRSRYPGLNIQTTTTGASVGASSTAAAPSTPRPRKASTANGSTTKAKTAKRSASKVPIEEQDDGEDEEDLDEVDEDDDEEDEEESPKTKKSASKKTPATSKVATSKSANGVKANKKARAEAPASKATKEDDTAAAGNTVANTKRKRAVEDSPTPGPQSKKVKVASRSKKAVQAEAKVEDDDIPAEDEDEDADHTGKQQSRATKPIETNDQELALEAVEQLAAKSKKAPINVNTSKPLANASSPTAPIEPEQCRMPNIEDVVDENVGGLDHEADTSANHVERYMSSVTKQGRNASDFVPAEEHVSDTTSTDAVDPEEDVGASNATTGEASVDAPTEPVETADTMAKVEDANIQSSAVSAPVDPEATSDDKNLSVTSQAIERAITDEGLNTTDEPQSTDEIQA